MAWNADSLGAGRRRVDEDEGERGRGRLRDEGEEDGGDKRGRWAGREVRDRGAEAVDERGRLREGVGAGAGVDEGTEGIGGGEGCGGGTGLEGAGRAVRASFFLASQCRDKPKTRNFPRPSKRTENSSFKLLSKFQFRTRNLGNSPAAQPSCTKNAKIRSVRPRNRGIFARYPISDPPPEVLTTSGGGIGKRMPTGGRDETGEILKK